MIRFLCLKVAQIKHRNLPVIPSNGNLFTTSSPKPITNLPKSGFPQSLSLSYLQESCGLSLQAAIAASKKLQIETTENPDLVLNLLRTNGFTQIQIKNLISKRPLLLLVDLDNTLRPNIELFKSLGFSGATLPKMVSKNPRVLEVDAKTVVEFFRENAFSEKQIATLTMKRPTLYAHNVHKNFKPKLEFFKSLGFSEFDVARMLSSQPYVLERSLENQIMPCIKVLRTVVGNDINVQKVVKAHCSILEFNVEESLEQNVSILVHHGVPKSLILKMFLCQPRSLLLKTDRLSEIIGEVKKLCFDPTKLLFLLAIQTKATVTKALWEQKLEAFKSFGLSKDEINLAFKKQPMFMLTSGMKIRKLMDFYVNKVNIEPSVISKNPNLILFSLEKRIIPRCSVLKILMSKELIKEGVNLIHVFQMTEKMFVEKLVAKYQILVPEVVKARQGRIEFRGFPRNLKMQMLVNT
ncbi:hypothetical protein JCGZ_11318 [Jatropha curcas]|uniref:Uncharacterized protein n=1 Tax=Jatropha curcas TaxID=180498 RepID=A0A067K489_JATCU|nr:transcription termination factor MTERF5, chloroplastic [Jatropha curcas]KDP30942.1 hypothetical protein JCGZ_11318 [Jatropha curcas]